MKMFKDLLFNSKKFSNHPLVRNYSRMKLYIKKFIAPPYENLQVRKLRWYIKPIFETVYMYKNT